jgi:hypothetical protein
MKWHVLKQPAILPHPLPSRASRHPPASRKALSAMNARAKARATACI